MVALRIERKTIVEARRALGLEFEDNQEGKVLSLPTWREGLITAVKNPKAWILGSISLVSVLIL